MSASTDRPTASGRHRASSARNTEPAATDGMRTSALVLLIVTVVVMAVLPDLVHYLFVKRDPEVIDFPRFPVSRNVSAAAAVGLFLVCSVIVVRRGRPRGNVGGLILLLLALLVPYLIGPDWPGKADILKIALAAAVILAVWSIAAPIDALKWVSISGSIFGIYSIIGGLIAPEYINYRVDSDKAFISNWQLAGPFAHSNALALYCLLALALSPLIASVRWRVLNVAILCTAIVASASRTALIAVGVLALWWIFCRLRSMASVRLAGTALIGICAAAVLILPLLDWNPYAISGRGYAWATSLSAWRESRLLGLGVDWFTTTAHVSANPASWAFRQGHNLFIDTLAKSGLVGICLLVLVLLAATRSARALDDSSQQVACFGYLIAFLVASTTEATWFLLPTMSLFPVVGLVFAVLLAGDGNSWRGHWPRLFRLRTGPTQLDGQNGRPGGRND